MPRRRVVAKREILPDPLYNSQLVTKFINSVMERGKKSLAEGKVELKPRRAKEAELVPVDRAADVVAERVKTELARLMP